MKRNFQIIASGSMLILLIVAGLSFSLVSYPALAQLLDPTEQRATVEALVQMRFTQTAEALGLEATADRLFADALTATSMAEGAPTFVPSPSPTPLPPVQTTPTVTREQGSVQMIETATPQSAPETDVPPSVQAAQLVAEGWRAFWEQRDRDAISLFTQVIDLQPDWADGYRSRALLHYINGSYDDAEADYSRAIELAPSAALYVGRGLTYELLLDTEAAIADYTQAIELNPTYDFSYAQRGNLYFQQEDYETALADLNQLIALNPALVFNYDLRGQIHEELGNRAERRFDGLMFSALNHFIASEYESAIDDFTDTLEVSEIDDIQDSYAYFGRGLVQNALADPDSALADFALAIEENPALGVAYFEMQLIYDSRENDEASLDILNRAIENAPDYANTWLSRAFFYEEAGNFEASTPDYWRWLELINLSDVDWRDRFVVGEPFTVQMEYGHIYRAPFAGTAGQTISAEARTIPIGTSSVDTLLVLLDANGKPLIANDDGGEEFNSAIANFTLPEDGEYTLVIGHAGAGDWGLVEVNLKIGS